MRISRREIKRNEAPALATGFHPSRSRFPEEAPRVFSPFYAGEQRDRPPFHLSSPRFISIFLRAFCVQFHLASLPCHVLFLFPRLSLCHSRSRRARSSCFTTLLSLPLALSLPRSPFSISTLSFSPRSFALLIHFMTVVLSPFFTLLFLVSRSFHRFFLYPPLARLPPFPPPSLSLFRRSRCFHLLVPSSLHA